MNATFITHPSVRIKGTENNYNPSQCFDPLCDIKTPHMHCPFCVKSDSYCDPVILKAHYRVKHVDKGIEFAGLKILRCCDHCDIVGIIKGEKKFKGAHWHCYKCRNGFNRRDEAVKHYKTHFRNPQTTFQIQIAQEVNQPFGNTLEHQTSQTTVTGEEMSIHPALTEAVTCMATTEDQTFQQTSHLTLSNGKLEGSVQMPVAANETVGLSDTQTIMIIQEQDTVGSDLSERYATQVICSEDVEADDNDTSIMESGSPGEVAGKQEELEQRVQELEMINAEHEQQIQQLQEQIVQQNVQISAYQRREEELVEQLSIPLDKGIQELLQLLESQHKDLLHQQLAQLKRSYLHAHNLIHTTCSVTVPHSSGGGDTLAVLTNDMNSQASEAVKSEHSQINQNMNNNSTVAMHSSANIGSEKSASPSLSDQERAQFEMALSSAYSRMEDAGDSLTIDSDNIPIENDGCPAAKRRKE